MVTLCTTHEASHRIFNTEPNYAGGLLDAPGEPDFGAVGDDVQGTSEFDGWGYAHPYRNENRRIREVDAFAIPEALDEDFAYYSGGMRVFSFGGRGLEEVGRFIDQGGNDSWGVETFTSKKFGRLLAGSDRDFCLYILRYTGSE